MTNAPTLVAIDHDDYYARHIGQLDNGLQFFLTEPFVPPQGQNQRREFIALYMFDSTGHFVDAQIDELDLKNDSYREEAERLYQRRLKEAGVREFCRIEIAPFSVTRYGIEFGLIVRELEDEDDVCCVEMQPGNYRAFFEPWDSGEYDT